VILPPGTILQQMYLKERLRGVPPGVFVEIGAGQGIVSATLLRLGWRGTGYDLNPESLAIATRVNAEAVAAGRYRVVNKDWLADPQAEPADLIISCMVLEHMDEEHEALYFERCRERLKPHGLGILLVPGGPQYWGVEDEIAGHQRRYTFTALHERIGRHGLDARHMAGLTYPVSNLLFPVSEFLVRRAERHKAALSMDDRTRQSGNRNVRFKTTFPGVLKLVLNEVVMYPFHVLQKLFSRNRGSMVIYAEFGAP
jgi:SAM-dependent methyltransferase